jgi:ABC-type transport system substrate-binding protein
MEPFRPVEPEPFTPADFEVPMAPGVRVGGGAASSGTRVLRLALGVALLVTAVGLAFAVGRATSPATSPAANTVPQGPGGGAQGGVPTGPEPGASADPNAQPGRSLNPNANGQPGGFPGDDNGGFGRDQGRGGVSMAGTVVSATATSVTITLASGQTVTLPIDGNTTFHQQAAATQADVMAGRRVLVQIAGGFGEEGDDEDEGGGAPIVSDVTLVP